VDYSVLNEILDNEMGGKERDPILALDRCIRLANICFKERTTDGHALILRKDRKTFISVHTFRDID
jgi:hypothetical protein